MYLDMIERQASVGTLSEVTAENWRADLTEFAETIGEQIITDDVTGEHIDLAITKYARTPDKRYKDATEKSAKAAEQGRAVPTQVRYWQSLHRFFAHAEIRGWVHVSPMPYATLRPRPRGRNSELRTARTAMTAGDALALLRHGPVPDRPNARPHERNEARDRLLLHLLAICGPRVSELCNARISDFQRDDDGITQWRIIGKGSKGRTVPLSPVLVDLLNAYLAVRPAPKPAAAELLLVTGRGNPLAPRDVQRLLHRAATRVAAQTGNPIRDITPHGLRHTAATLMLHRGWDIKVVSRLCGHASIASTNAYLDDVPGELVAAVADSPLTAHV